MTDTIIGIAGLVITILGIPGALAFAFSSIYKKVLGYVLIAVLFLLFLFTLTWTGGVLFAHHTLREHINGSNAQSALDTVEFWKLSTGSFSILFAVFLGASMWVFGLRFVDDLKKWNQALQDEKDAAAAKNKHLAWHSESTQHLSAAPPATRPQENRTQESASRKQETS